MTTKRRRFLIAGAVVLPLALGTIVLAQVGGAHWLSISISEDPGISWMVVTDTPDYRVLRVFARPGATRRMHRHDEAAWHVFTPATGTLLLTIEGHPPTEVAAGQSVTVKGGTNHTFKNVGTETATIVEVFGKVHQ